MQDRQARNKDPYSSSDESSDSAWEGQNRKFDVYELVLPLHPHISFAEVSFVSRVHNL
jgi:hypothetical protein